MIKIFTSSFYLANHTNKNVVFSLYITILLK